MKTITTLKEALEKIKQLKTAYYFRRGSEHVSIPDSVGRELGEDIVADYMSPAFDIAAMDGFAFHSEDVYPLKIKGSVYAGDQRAEIKRSEAMAIATGAFTALEMVVRSYLTEIPRAMRIFVINEDVVLPENGFEYVLFVKIAHNTASAMSLKMKLFDGEYNTAIISASPRSTVVDGYLLTDRDIRKGEHVNVFLFN